MATDSERDAALRVLRQDYYDDVRGCASDLYEQAKTARAEDEPHLREWLLDRVHEACDGHARVIYTGLAIETLLFSDNDSAYVDEYGTDGVSTDGGINWSALAFAAFERDVMEHLEALGLDVNADDLGIGDADADADAADED
jgi:hypothetical protein